MLDVHLLPGEYFVGDARYRIRTMLGSCVSITLWQPRLKIGAMSHFLLYERERGRGGIELSGRYGSEALELMVRELRALGVQATDCQAKIFGGAIMFPQLEKQRRPSIGRRNGESAEELLRLYHIPIVSESLFGVGHRHIIFNVSTGDVWVKQADLGETHGPVKEAQ